MLIRLFEIVFHCAGSAPTQFLLQIMQLNVALEMCINHRMSIYCNGA